MPTLTKLERATFRDAWDSEADFTAWLGSDDGNQLLSEALGVGLEALATEQAIGSFRADLIFRDTNDTLVIVENQVGTTDHSHLGQALTYSAGAAAGTVVWIAGNFRDEHRAAVDWYNEVTNEQVRFYALEIEVWKVGDGKVAPKFNVVSQPNDWRKVISIETADIEERRGGFDYREFWVRVNEKIEAKHGLDKPLPPGRSWAFFGSKLSRRIKLGASVDPIKGLLRVDFSTQGRNAFPYAYQLIEARDEIEKEFGSPLTWELKDGGGRCMVMLDRLGVDLKDNSKWDEYAEWMVENLARLRRAFWDRVDDLDPEAYV